MTETYYTHARWHVKEGKAEAFIAAWKKFAQTLAQVPNSPPVQGTLIQSLSDPLEFYSFGPWEKLEDIQVMRNDEEVKKALADLFALCEQARPGNYQTAAKISYPGNRQTS